MTRFDEALEWATEKVRPHVHNGCLEIRSKGPLPIRDVLWNDLGLEWVPGETYRERIPANLGFTFELGPEKSRGQGIAIGKGAAEYLVLRAFDCPESYDLAVDIVATNLLAGCELPRPLSEFAALVLANRWSRPRKKPGRPRNWERDYLIRSWVEEVVVKFGLFRTRNDASDRTSACDVISEALMDCGCDEVDFRAAKETCTKATFTGDYERLRASMTRKLAGVKQPCGLGPLAYRLPVSGKWGPLPDMRRCPFACISPQYSRMQAGQC